MSFAVAVVAMESGVALAAAAEPAMETLPPGSVRPRGWLLRQMELQRDGLTGNAEKLYVDIGKSDWLTGGKRGGEFSWERGPYYAKGLVSLAFALDDAALKSRAKKWIDAFIASQRSDGDFGPKSKNWWANMVALWAMRDWCDATGDVRIVPFMERYFAFQRADFAKGGSLAADSQVAVARGGDEIDVLLWLARKTGKEEWRTFAREIAAQTADWTTYYIRGGEGSRWIPNGHRAHIVNFMQGLKTPPLKWLLCGGERDRRAFGAALAPDGWAMRRCGRPDRAVNGTEPLTDRSASGGTELCATTEHIISAKTALAALGDAEIADDIEVAAYNTLPSTIAQDGKGIRYYNLLNQPLAIDANLLFYCGRRVPILLGPYSGFGCCRSNFHSAWPKFCESMWMKRGGGLAAVAYGDCRVETPLATIAESGGYPFSDRVTLTVEKSSGGKWPLYVRIPGWCEEASVKACGGDVAGCGGNAAAKPGSFVRIEREWRAGDVVELCFPSRPKVSRWKDDSIAVMRGSLLYALDIKADVKNVPAKRWKELKADASGVLRDVELGFPMREMRPAAPWNYALLADGSGIPSFEARGEGLSLRLAVRAVRTSYAGWGTMNPGAGGRALDPAPSPVPSWAADGEAETIELVPIAFTQLRIALFPWINAGRP